MGILTIRRIIEQARPKSSMAREKGTPQKPEAIYTKYFKKAGEGISTNCGRYGNKKKRQIAVYFQSHDSPSNVLDQAGRR